MNSRALRFFSFSLLIILTSSSVTQAGAFESDNDRIKDLGRELAEVIALSLNTPRENVKEQIRLTEKSRTIYAAAEQLIASTTPRQTAKHLARNLLKSGILSAGAGLLWNTMGFSQEVSIAVGSIAFAGASTLDYLSFRLDYRHQKQLTTSFFTGLHERLAQLHADRLATKERMEAMIKSIDCESSLLP